MAGKRTFAELLKDIGHRMCSEATRFEELALQHGLDPERTSIFHLAAVALNWQAANGNTKALQIMIDEIDGPLPRTTLLGGAPDTPALRFEFAEAQPPALIEGPEQ